MEQKDRELNLERIRLEAERRGYVLLPVQTPLCPDCESFALSALDEKSGLHRACA